MGDRHQMLLERYFRSRTVGSVLHFLIGCRLKSEAARDIIAWYGGDFRIQSADAAIVVTMGCLNFSFKGREGALEFDECAIGFELRVAFGDGEQPDQRS